MAAGAVAWCAPVWFDVSASDTALESTAVVTAHLVPSAGLYTIAARSSQDLPAALRGVAARVAVAVAFVLAVFAIAAVRADDQAVVVASAVVVATAIVLLLDVPLRARALLALALYAGTTLIVAAGAEGATSSTEIAVQFAVAGVGAVAAAAHLADRDARRTQALERDRERRERLTRRVAAGEMLREALAYQASVDPLTGLLNRGAFVDDAAHALAAAARDGEPASVLVVDVDGFKPVNDTFGHATGDAVLRAIARSVSESVRGVDRVGRLGGDEFIVFLPNADATEATIVAERVRAVVAVLAERHGIDAAAHVSVSIGVAQRSLDEPFEHLWHRADEAMYRAKRAGGNQVTVASAPSEPARDETRASHTFPEA